MDQLNQNIVSLTLETRLMSLERPYQVPEARPIFLAPQSEQELESIKRLPDCVRDLQVFDGNPIEYVSWVNNVESILKDHEIVRDRPIYGAILKHIRQKIRGDANNSLVSFNIFNADWATIKRCLSLYYADKRDIQSLENQLITMRQGSDSLENFYSKVNHQLSLIINKIRTDNYSEDGVDAGLKKDLSHLVKVQKPQSLPDAYAACIELENLDFRKIIASDYKKDLLINNFGGNQNGNRNRYPRQPHSNNNKINNVALPFQNTPIQHFQFQSNIPPPRPTQPKPPVPMEVDSSIRSANVNYMNKPKPVIRHSNESSNIPRKNTRIFNIQSAEEPNSQYLHCYINDPTISSIPYINYTTTNGQILKFLIDTGANKNFIRGEIVLNSVELEKPFIVHSAGNSTIVDFYILPNLTAFDGIIGDDTLRDFEAVIDRKNDLLHIVPNIQIKLQRKETTQVGSNMTINSKEMLEPLLEEFSHLFDPVNDHDAINTVVKAEIRTTTDEPIYSKSCPYPPPLRKEVDAQIKKMLDDGIIRPSKSPYNSPLWVVPKKATSSGENQYRVIIDYKRLNAVTIPDAYPIPDITHTLACLHGNKFFSTLDLTSGFHQVKMREKDIAKTAFSTPNGKYEFLRLPFGLKNAPAIFQRMINDVLRPLIGICCYVYIDDIIVFGEIY